MAKRIIIFIFLLPLFSLAQTDIHLSQEALKKMSQNLTLPENAKVVSATIYNGDTIPYVTLDPLVCFVPRVFINPKDAVKWDRMKYNVKKVYPYAILAAAKLKEYDRVLATMPNEGERKRYMKNAEEQLKDQFGEELKNLSMTQGRILIKLIDRETGKTTYDIVKQMRGSFSAFMWQSVAVMFSSDLKDDYNGQGEDKAIEDAIRLIENGDF